MHGPKMTRRRGNVGPSQTKQNVTKENYGMYKEGIGDTGDYCYYCVQCQLMYFYDTLVCTRCQQGLISKTERKRDLREKAKRYKREKEERNKRRQKWKQLKRGQNNSKYTDPTSARSALPNYDKWDYFEPDSDSDPENTKNKEMKNLSNLDKRMHTGLWGNTTTNINSDRNFNQKDTSDIPSNASVKFSKDTKKMVGAVKNTTDNDLKGKAENRDAARQHKEKGNEFAQQKQYLKAIECYEDGLKADNSCLELYTNLALCLNKTLQYEKAIQACDTVIDQLKAISDCSFNNRNTLFKAYSRKGLALFNLLKFEEALECFNQSVKCDFKDDVVCRYIHICCSYIENKKAIKHFVHRQKRERLKQKYSCPSVHPALRWYHKYCCKSVIEYSKMTEEQVLALKPEDFVAIEGIVTMCDNTEVLLNMDLDIKEGRTLEIADKGTNRCSLFVCTLMKMLCTYMNKIIQAARGDVLKKQNVDITGLLINYADTKIKAEHIIETLGSLAQKNPLYLDLFIICVRPVLTFFALRFVSCHIAMFFIGTVVRSINVSREIQNLVKDCNAFWDVFFKRFDSVCADFATYKVPQKHLLEDGVMLKLSRGADIKRKYCNYFSFLGRICLDSEVNDFLISTYAGNIRNICRHINDQLQKDDGCVFYYMEFIANLYLGGGHMREEIIKICWDGVMHVLKTKKDKMTILTVLHTMDILTNLWALHLTSDKMKCDFARKIEAEAIENIIAVLNKNCQEISVVLVKALSCFVKYNCELEKANLLKKINTSTNGASGTIQNFGSSIFSNVDDTSMNIIRGSNRSTNSSTYTKESINAFKTTDVTSSKYPTLTSIIKANNSTNVMTSEPIATIGALNSYICGNGSKAWKRGTYDYIPNIENNVQLVTNKVYEAVDKRVINNIIPILYEGLSCKQSHDIHKECAFISAILSEHLIFFQCINERKDITITKFIQRIMDVFNLHENRFKEKNDYSVACEIALVINYVIKDIYIFGNKKQIVLKMIRPLIVKFIYMFSDVEHKKFRQSLVIMLSLILVRNAFPDLINQYNLRRILLTDGQAKKMLDKKKN